MMEANGSSPGAPRAAGAGEGVTFDDAGIMTLHVAAAASSGRNQNTSTCSQRPDARLSVISQKYDLGEKGFLDETEQQLRNLDTENTGQLANEKVYDLMQQHIEGQRKLFQMKKLLAGVTIFAVLLALTTLATSFAAATLAKDTSASQRTSSLIREEALMSRDGTMAIGVHTIGHEIRLDRHDHGGGLADHACVASTEVAQVWEEIASEFEVHLILVKALAAADDGSSVVMLDRDLIPLTGVKSFSGGRVCFTSFNEIAACVTFGDDACSSELGDEELATMTFPNTELVQV